jgi:orotate phosphoribosyltransferase
LLTTGGSVEKVCREVEKVGGKVIGVSVVCNRGSVAAEVLRIPRLHALAEVTFTANDADNCPECRSGMAIVEDMGHGDDYKKEHPDYAGGYEKLQSV